MLLNKGFVTLSSLFVGSYFQDDDLIQHLVSLKLDIIKGDMNNFIRKVELTR